MSFRLITSCCLCVIASVLLSVSVGCSSVEPQGMISGTVTSDGEACGDCQIEIFDPVKLRSIGTMVNGQGTFELKDIPFGEYQVAVHQLIDPHDASDKLPVDA